MPAQGQDHIGPHSDNHPWPNIRLSDTDRLEAFSDGVFSITITLLVFDIVRPEYMPGHLLEKLLAQRANYIAFLASFFYVGIIWLTHRSVFSRVRSCSRSLHLANLVLLLTSVLIPFPTAVLSTALQTGSSLDAKVAVELYAAIGGLMCLSWLLVFHVLSINPHLLKTHAELTFFPQERHRALTEPPLGQPQQEHHRQPEQQPWLPCREHVFRQSRGDHGRVGRALSVQGCP